MSETNSIRAKTNKIVDKMGIVVSFGCLVHCALLPMAVIFAPILWWEKYDFAFWCFAFALSALSTFFVIKKRVKNKTLPLYCAALGWIWALVVIYLDLGHFALSITGLLLLISHLILNHKNKNICGCD